MDLPPESHSGVPIITSTRLGELPQENLFRWILSFPSAEVKSAASKNIYGSIMGANKRRSIITALLIGVGH